jgi:hypothetical protein
MNQRPGRIWVPEAPHLWLPKRRYLEIETPTPRYQGWFNIKLIDAKTGAVKRELDFPNLIVDAGLDFIGQSGTPLTCMTYAGMGTGGTAPANSDTTLQTPIGTRITRDSTGTSSGPAFAYWQQTFQFTFLEPNANGNLAEIGLFSASSGGSMWTRQVLKDSFGVPTTITKTSAERLQVTYNMRLYSPTVDVSGNVTITGVGVVAYTVRAANISSSGSWGAFPLTGYFAGGSTGSYLKESNVLGTTSSTIAGTEDGTTIHTSISIAAYTPGSFQRQHTIFWDTNRGNFGTGVGGMAFGGTNGNAYMFQCSFGTQIAKNALKQLTIVAMLAWGRYP